MSFNAGECNESRLWLRMKKPSIEIMNTVYKHIHTEDQTVRRLLNFIDSGWPFKISIHYSMLLIPKFNNPSLPVMTKIFSLKVI